MPRKERFQGRQSTTAQGQCVWFKVLKQVVIYKNSNDASTNEEEDAGDKI